MAAHRNVTLVAVVTAAVSACAAPIAGPDPSSLELVDLWRSGEGGYRTYRIPAVVAAADGTLLAFAEGRRNGASDTGDIDLLLRRSRDGGDSWGPVQVVWDDGANVCGNPCPVVDRSTGAVWLLATWNAGEVHESRVAAGFGEDSRRVFALSSDDAGATWSEPREITADVKRPDWTWYATGPGAGIQLERGAHAGRLVIPCDHKRATADGEVWNGHTIHSDDGGVTWSLGGATPDGAVNECEVAELEDGTLLLNLRNYDHSVRARQVAFSADGGATWTDQRHDPVLVEPTCQASLRRLRWSSAERSGLLLFSNPATTRQRSHLTVRASRDDGATWEFARLLYAGSSAYSCLVALPDGRVGCLFERDGYGALTFARFELGWVAGDRWAVAPH